MSDPEIIALCRQIALESAEIGAKRVLERNGFRPVKDSDVVSENYAVTKILKPYRIGRARLAEAVSKGVVRELPGAGKHKNYRVVELYKLIDKIKKHGF